MISIICQYINYGKRVNVRLEHKVIKRILEESPRLDA